jgi:NAD(P)-dependent dehydrogenase (short-subunit alcohol dehydrogenase family)
MVMGQPNGKVAIITGAAPGQRAAEARLFAAEGTPRARDGGTGAG